MIDCHKRMTMKMVLGWVAAALFATLWFVEWEKKAAWKADCQTAEKALAAVRPEIKKMMMENTRLNNQRPPGDAKDWDEFWKRVLEAGAGKGENTAP